MKTIATLLMCTSLMLAAGGATAQDSMKKGDGMAKEGMMKEGMMKNMNMQECKDHMAMSQKEGMKKDDAMMKKDAMCADMMKKSGTTGEPMKK